MNSQPYQERESWKNRLGFIFAALGSAVGLGSIWRFPYIVGENGGAAFICVYILCLLLIGFPTLISEILIGRTCQTSPFGAFRILGRNKPWALGGKMTIFTGFIVSSFYSVIAGLALGYFIEAIKGNLTGFLSEGEALNYFTSLSSSLYWTMGFHAFFMALAIFILFSGVRKGIEVGSKIMMPLLICVLHILVVKGFFLPGAKKSFSFLFAPDFRSLTPKALLMALGQAFFTLSLGQGTMVTYGSYLGRKEDLLKSCFPVVLLNTLIAILMGLAIFPIVFSAHIEPSVGPALIFETLPLVFSQIPWGGALSILFFFLVALAALTSEISALEPMISYLIDEKGFSRKKAVLSTSLGAFLLGVPSALSFTPIWRQKLFGMSFFDWISQISVNILIPLGGLIAVLLVAYRWGIKEAIENLKVEKDDFFYKRKPLLALYFRWALKYIAPILIILILLTNI